MAPVTGTAAGLTRLAPHFPAPSAALAGRTHLEFDRNRRTCTRLPPRQLNLGQQAIARSVSFHKGVAHAFNTFADRREVDRHFIRKRSTELSIGRRLPLDGDPRVIHAPVLFHDWALA